MKELIQHNIRETDPACEIQVRIDFSDRPAGETLDLVNEAIESKLMAIGIAFHTAQGEDFLEAALLDFGTSAAFAEMKTALNQALADYRPMIATVSFTKAEYLQASFEFIAEQQLPLEEVHRQAAACFGHVQFGTIQSADNSPEHTFFSGSDDDKTITLFVSQLTWNGRNWVRFSIGSKRLNDDELQELSRQIDRVHPNAARVQWNGLDYDHANERWELPVHHALFEFVD